MGHEVALLVDSGAERSVIPQNLIPASILFPSRITLTGVGGSPIKSYGQCCVKVAVPSLRRVFSVTFIAADVKPILGADFLTTYGLILNMKDRLLNDPLTNMNARLNVIDGTNYVIHASESSENPSFISEKFPKLLSPPDYSELPVTTVSHSIETTGTPVSCKPRPLSPVKYDIAKKEFQALLDLHIIRPSSSPWSSPLHMVKKKNGSWRPCGDYRRVNAMTVSDQYPLPNIETFHHRLFGATIFSKVDIVKAYHFIPMRTEDIQKTAISTPFGCYEYLRMPFGLRNSSSTFQRFIDSQLLDFDFTVAYVDDILVFSHSEEEHKAHLDAVLSRLESVGLRININKCQFFQQEIEFLGYIVSKDGIRPPPDRTSALRDLSIPKDSKELMRLIGMFSFYQRCIPNFASLVLPLRNVLLQKTFSWTPRETAALDKLKDELVACVNLSFPSRHEFFQITVDASNLAIGGCLSQTQDGISKPLSFFSRKLSSAEINYSAFDKELLACFAAVKKWRDLIDGSKSVIFSDHKPLEGAFRNTKPRISSRQQRQLSFISEYVSDIVHIAGKDNIVADTLSRSVNSMSSNSASPCDLPSIAKAQAQSPDLFKDFQTFDIGVKDTMLHCETSFPNPRPVVPEAMRRQIFDAMHSLCHAGIKTTTRLIASRYFWKDIRNDVKAWCKECLDCQSSKIGLHTKKPIKDLPTPTARFTNVHMDIVGPLEPPDIESPQKPRYLLTVIDSWTRWIEAVPLVDISSSSICSSFLSSWVARFGPPLHLSTDRGTQFCGELANELNNLLGIHHIRTSSFNPRANGMVERAHRTLKAGLKARGRYWLSQLPIVLMGMRMAPAEDGTSPFSRITGEQPMVPHILPGNCDMTQLATQKNSEVAHTSGCVSTE